MGYALIHLQRVSNLSNPLGLSGDNANLQFHDQYACRLVFDSNAGSGRSHNTFAVCSSWGPHSDYSGDWHGGQGTSEGGNHAVWERFLDFDSKFLHGYDDMEE